MRRGRAAGGSNVDEAVVAAAEPQIASIGSAVCGATRPQIDGTGAHRLHDAPAHNDAPQVATGTNLANAQVPNPRGSSNR